MTTTRRPRDCASWSARALAEDFGTLGDLTSIATIPEDATGAADIVARRYGVLAGVAAATEVFTQVDPAIDVVWHAGDGDTVEPDQRLAAVSGNLRSILGAERTALNLLQHASGVATATHAYVDATAGRAKVRDTRKTLPGLRAIEKAAVRAGGGFNHRECLSDAVLIKDNHLAYLDLGAAVARVEGALARPHRRGGVRHARAGPRGGGGGRRSRSSSTTWTPRRWARRSRPSTASFRRRSRAA